jgi:hypothetical protein
MMRLDAMSDVPCPISLMPMRVRCDELACLFSQAMPMAKSKKIAPLSVYLLFTM